MIGLQAVIFDMDGTLLEWKDPTLSFPEVARIEFGLVHRLLLERGHTPPDVETFSSAMYSRAVADWRQAMRTCQSYTVHNLFAAALPEMDLTVSEEELNACIAAFESFPNPTGAKEDAVATLTALQESGLKLGLISNSWSTPGSRDEELRRTGLLDLLEVRVYSSAMDVMKPHPGIFRRALAELGVSADQAVMVGDMLEMDIRGAQGVGIRSVWLDNQGEGLPEEAAVQPDATIRQLGELVEVLGLWLGS
jgi:HAD superfamily hydrolase (TIGR01549 family)